jgi:large subunit ribosomal protein L3
LPGGKISPPDIRVFSEGSTDPMAVRAILGRKKGMTQVFLESGEWVPATVLQLGPCVVTSVRPGAAQLGFETIKERRTRRPQRGFFKKLGVPPQRTLREVEVEGEPPAVGSLVRVGDLFQPGEPVDVSGVTKGKGFQGTVRLHHFNRGPASHGSMNVRQPGSIGSSSDPARVFKGMRMASHMGQRRETSLNLRVVSVDPDQNLLLVRGPVPGPSSGLVLVRKSRRGPSKKGKA